MVLFRYGVKSFTLSMVEAAIEVTGGQVPAEVIQRLVDKGRRYSAGRWSSWPASRRRWPRWLGPTAWS